MKRRHALCSELLCHVKEQTCGAPARTGTTVRCRREIRVMHPARTWENRTLCEIHGYSDWAPYKGILRTRPSPGRREAHEAPTSSQQLPSLYRLGACVLPKQETVFGGMPGKAQSPPSSQVVRFNYCLRGLSRLSDCVMHGIRQGSPPVNDVSLRFLERKKERCLRA